MIKAYRKSVAKEPAVKRYLLILDLSIIIVVVHKPEIKMEER